MCVRVHVRVLLKQDRRGSWTREDAKLRMTPRFRAEKDPGVEKTRVSKCVEMKALFDERA